MSQVSNVLRDTEFGYLFWCPGCDEVHHVNTRAGNGPVWGFNGNVDMPTFTPSVLVRGRRFTDKGNADHAAWVDAGCPKPAPTFEATDSVCHTFITNGIVQFLGDCTHHLAGQTVDLPAFPHERQETS